MKLTIRAKLYLTPVLVYLATALQPCMALSQNEVQKLLASDGTLGDSFGRAVAISGDTAIIGAAFDESPADTAGSAYVFTRVGSTWTEQTKLVASDQAAGDRFGLSVAIDGDTAIIGATFDDEKGLDSGSAYVFTRTGSTWTEQAKLQAGDGAPDDWFGISVAIDGDTAVVGAILDDDQGDASGSAYVFTRAGSTWTEQSKLVAGDTTSGDRFGISVAIDGDTALIGAALNDDKGVDSGSAYVFTRTASTWNEQAKLLASDGTAGDHFGVSVAINGNSSIIGADFHGDNGFASGAAYVFTSVGSIWAEQAKLLASDGTASDTFGGSVSISGDSVIIGALRDTPSGNFSGSAYLFARSGSSWSEQAKLLASDGAADDIFGSGVAISGNTAIVGAPGDDDLGVSSGSVYMFDVSLSTVPDGDGDSVPDEIDNCPVTPNAAQSDIDMDGLGDLCDACPNVALPDQCDENGSAAGEISPDAGGAVQTPDGNLLIQADPGDLSSDATLSVTETIRTDPEVDLIVGTNPGLGQGLAFYDLQPEGLQFTSAITVTVKADVTALNQNQRNRLSVYLYTDTNGDGVADQFIEVAGVSCIFAEELDGTVIATCTFQLDHFSEYAVIVPLDSDRDGIFDQFDLEEDICPSTAFPIGTVTYGTCDSDIADFLIPQEPGCSVSQQIERLATDAKSNGQLVSRVDKLLVSLQQQGLLEPQEKDPIKTCVAQK